MHPVMNNTKWDELREAMYDLGELRPRWRTKDVSGYLSPWDGEWLCHFRVGGYTSIEWVEIGVGSVMQEAAVLAALRAVHVPGERVGQGFRVYGYSTPGKPSSYL